MRFQILHIEKEESMGAYRTKGGGMCGLVLSL